jgi:hypothetical protein
MMNVWIMVVLHDSHCPVRHSREFGFNHMSPRTSPVKLPITASGFGLSAIWMPERWPCDPCDFEAQKQRLEELQLYSAAKEWCEDTQEGPLR